MRRNQLILLEISRFERLHVDKQIYPQTYPQKTRREAGLIETTIFFWRSYWIDFLW